eukprot:2818716-Pleurochrysis_carterae.AAC.2
MLVGGSERTHKRRMPSMCAEAHAHACVCGPLCERFDRVRARSCMHTSTSWCVAAFSTSHHREARLRVRPPVCQIFFNALRSRVQHARSQPVHSGHCASRLFANSNLYCYLRVFEGRERPKACV